MPAKEPLPERARALTNERVGHDTLTALATADGPTPRVGTVNGYYGKV